MHVNFIWKQKRTWGLHVGRHSGFTCREEPAPCTTTRANRSISILCTLIMTVGTRIRVMSNRHQRLCQEGEGSCCLLAPPVFLTLPSSLGYVVVHWRSCLPSWDPILAAVNPLKFSQAPWSWSILVGRTQAGETELTSIGIVAVASSGEFIHIGMSIVVYL